MHSREDIINTIQMLEAKFPVEDWNYNGVNYWPLIKRDLFFQAYTEFTPAAAPQSNQSAIGRKLIKIRRVVSRVLTSISKSIFIPEASVLFIGNKSQHVDENGESFNRLLKYQIDHVLGSGLSAKYYLYTDDSIREDLSQFVYARKMLNRLKAKPPIIFDEYDSLIAQYEIILSITFKDDATWSMIDSVDTLSNLFVSVLRKMKTKAIFETTYYNPVVYAINIAAARLGIPTVDVQHGGQGDLHIAYSHFTKAPPEGYALLPRYFWNWDEQSVNNISKWTQESDHQALNLGNPWVLYNRKQNGLPKDQNGKKRILVTLQTAKVPEVILAAIEKSHDKYDWWLRAHPTKKDQRETVKETLKNLNLLDHVNIDEAGDANLIQLLRSTDVHISRFSGSIIEAEQLGVYSIIIDKVGVETYQDIVDRGHALVSLGDEDMLLQTISETLLLPPFESDLDQQESRAQEFLRNLEGTT